ncbi:MAG TPA: glucoamylase family protein [Burkholderiales bacterium]|nr:glucoamylase family protein [Burkholderiales bacterium]
MERHGEALAGAHKLRPGRRGTGEERLLARLTENEAVLISAGELLKAAVARAQRIAPAGEWLLDNFHLIEEQVRTAKRHLPKAYSRGLPRLMDGPSAGLPRVYDIALEAISHGDGRLDAKSLRRFVAAYQSCAPLKLGELWAIPIMLRLALIENLRRVAARIGANTAERDLAERWADRMIETALQDPKSLVLVTADMARSNPPMASSFVAELARRLQGQSASLALPVTWIEQRLAELGLTIEHQVQSQTQEQAAVQVSMANSIGSLRLLGAIDWREFVETLSVVEQTLREDALYGAMDFATRDRYRHAVERIAKASPLAEGDVARAAIDLARAEHVGVYLIGKHVEELERAAQSRPSLLERLYRTSRRHALALYLGAIALVTGGFTAYLLMGAQAGGIRGPLLALLALAALVAASQLAVALVNRLATALARPLRLPRMDFSDGIPPRSRTLVVVPAMLASERHIEHLLETLEVRFLANRDENLHFALLTDFQDASEQTLPADAALELAARRGIDELNRKYASAERFFLFHRARRWNPGERCWMGYERKRGKLGELNALLRGGPIAVLQGVKYVITLDTDTQLPRDAARSLAGAMAHPLNRPRYDGQRGRVCEGHGILQPRMAVSMPSDASPSRYAQLFGADAGIDPYTRAVSDVYQDVFGEGSFIGKGIYDVDAFEGVLKGRFPENRILSHDLLEGCYARCGLISDVELYEAYPSRYGADVSRRHRWVRGDWQIAQWLLSRVPVEAGGRQANPLSWLAQWKILDNLRRSLAPLALVALVLAGWSWAVLAIVLAPAVLGALSEMSDKPVDVPLRRHLATAWRPGARHMAQALFTLACLPYEAFFSLDAIVRTASRLLTRSRLLEWTASSERDAEPSWRAMWIGPAAALAAAFWLSASPVLLLWLASPALAWWASRPLARREARLTSREIRFLHAAARKTWSFFERFVGAEDHWLPPDNFQEQPVGVVAHRTSPTNMGLSLLANLAAYDFGYVTAGELIERTDKALATMQGLERHRGHFYNWYDTLSLKPLPPLYVSSVDSGNLACHLLTLRPGLLALADAAILSPRCFEGLRDTAMLLGDASLQADLESPPTTARAARGVLERLAVRAAEITGSPWAQALARQCRAALGELELFSLDGAGDRPTLRALSSLENETGRRARERIGMIERLAHVAGELARMEYDFLIDHPRQLLAIGYNVAEHRRDAASYDLLASEARATTFVAIAQGELPQSGWFAMGRSLTSAGGEPALLSWSGSMFEYLMPLLVMPTYENTLLDRTCRAAVKRQIAYGRECGVPWGMSESGYNTVDAALNYQYRAFGVPGLGLKRGLMEDLVVAPYASALALMVAPEAACENLQRLAAAGLEGTFGFYEAIDYTASRLPRGGPDDAKRQSVVIRSFMAHHQGMVLLSLAYLLLDRPMQKRFQSDARFQATALLLQERIPRPSAVYLESAGRFDTRAAPSEAQMPVRVLASADTPTPQVQLLSNGRYHVMVTNAGGGYSRWKDLALTRWREDPTCDNWGSFCYLRDLESGRLWSSAHQPSLERAQSYEAIFSEARAEFRRRDHDYDTHTEIVVSSEDDIELRRLRITNRAATAKTLEVTSFAEVVLAPGAADALHPAFSNLFVQTEILAERQAILCTRRPRSAAERTPSMFHLMAVHGAPAAEFSYETDRARFIGRGRSAVSPRAMTEPLSGSEGSVLDPCVAIRSRIRLEPQQSALIDMVFGIGETREACLALAGKYRDRHLADRVFNLASTHGSVALRQINVTESDAQLYARLASAVLYASAALRADAGVLMKNRRGQSGLWGYAISGDLPIVLVRIGDAANLDLVRQLVQAHAYWRLKGLAVDLVIWNEDHAGYRQVLQDQIMGLVAAGSEAQAIERPGGIFVRRAEQISDEDRILFESVARAVLTDQRGTLAEQVGQRSVKERRLLARVSPDAERDARWSLPRLRVVHDEPQASPRGWPGELFFFNGTGGFSRDGREYVITTSTAQATPAPWVNVLANAHFGSVVSESGPGYTWSENAHEFRLTPWGNDAVGDASGEAFYLRDEDSGEFWSPTPRPCGGAGRYVTRHGFGYSVFEHSERGIRSELRIYVDLDAPVKFSVLKIANRSGRRRRLSATGYVEWVLGDLRPKTAMHVVSEIDPASGALYAANAYNGEFADRTAFFHIDDATRTVSANRTEFLGRNGTLANPAAMRRTQLSNKVGAGLDPCGALQVAFDLADGEEREIVFTLGIAGSARLAPRRALEKVEKYWERTLGAVQVETPERSFDLLANGWLVYQTLACRLWARSGHYQSGGAFGFRDQLQDVIALLHAEPGLARNHLLACAAHQFRDGDVQHWWHPPAGRGVRTHCSDDYLWLAWATSRYVLATGDAAVLEEVVHFLDGRPVNPEEDSYYGLPTHSSESANLYQHCVRAIEQGLRFGEHGLPLIGSGDWNDGMDQVGAKGKGESVWLGFFLYDVLLRFSRLARARGDFQFTERCESEAARLRGSLEQHGWDGAWYRRAYFDDGTPLGSAGSAECRIDSIAQSWSVLSGAGDPARSRSAMEALDRHLVRRSQGLVQLLDPPFDKGSSNPGYIKGYVPGVRENGGQYTHAAIWAAMAFAQLGDARRAWELFAMINPVNHASSAAAVAAYKVEPYVMAADVYAAAAHIGRGGWTWYTGSAGWMYQLAVESLLGLRLEGDKLRLVPCLPPHWPGFKLRYRYGDTVYRIAVLRDESASAESEHVIDLVDDRQEHLVEVRIRALP